MTLHVREPHAELDGWKGKNMGRLDAKVAVVTGAAAGLGAAIVEAFVAEGATVVGADVQVDAGKELAERLGDRARFVELDVTDEHAWQSVVDGVLGEFGRIDVLVNNAAVHHIAPVATHSYADFQKLMRVNVDGTFLGMRAVLPKMLEAESGSIINVSSMDGIRGMAHMSAYSSSKHAVIGLTRSVAAEVGPQHVRVNALCPGAMETQMLAGADLAPLGVEDPADLIDNIPFKRPAKPAEVANMVTFLGSDDASYCSGGEFVVDGAWTGAIPV